jgi:hypothetical protein
MTNRSRNPETIDLVLAVHAGILELDAITDDARREEVRALHEQLQQSAAVEAETEDHLPAWLLAGWPRIGDKLQVVEREAVELHLARCEACQSELSILVEIRRANGSPAPRRAWPRGVLLLGGWAVVATAASLLLWVRTPELTSPGNPATVLLPATLRGQEDGPQIGVPAGTAHVRFDLTQVFPGPRRRELSNAGTEKLLYVVEGPGADGAFEISEQSVEDFSLNPSFELKNRSGEALVAGRYVFRAWLIQGDSATVGEEFNFQLRLDSPD